MSDQDSKISVIVTVDNGYKHLSECLNSIISQKHSNLEILCIDMASNDGSKDILLTYADKDPRITVISEASGDLANALNLGVSRTSGTYACFVNGTDFISPDYVSSLLKAVLGGVAMVYCDGMVMYQGPETRQKKSRRKFKEGVIPADDAFIRNSNDMVGGRLYKTELLKEFKFEGFKELEETLFNYMIILGLDKVAITHNGIYYKRQLSDKKAPDRIIAVEMFKSLYNYYMFSRQSMPFHKNLSLAVLRKPVNHQSDNKEYFKVMKTLFTDLGIKSDILSISDARFLETVLNENFLTFRLNYDGRFRARLGKAGMYFIGTAFLGVLIARLLITG